MAHTAGATWAFSLPSAMVVVAVSRTDACKTQPGEVFA
jgi:hypothetical protein